VRLFTSPEEIPAGLPPVAVAIGKFDGLHVGHHAVLEILEREAAARGLPAVVVTFDRNPLAVIRPEACPDQLVSNEQKVELLAAEGVDATLMLTFDEALASVPAREWAEGLLVEGLQAQVVICGRDFRFGHRAQGDVELLGELGAERGFDVIPVDDVRGAGERRISSTWIRELLDEGRVREAAQVLGRPHVVRSVVVHGEHRGRELGFPTANLDMALAEGFIPAEGIYATWAVVDGVRYAAATSIGDNPTFDDVDSVRVEAHLLDADINAYGRTIELEFVDWIRPMLRFDGVDELIDRLADDVEQTRRILAAEEGRS